MTIPFSELLVPSSWYEKTYFCIGVFKAYEYVNGKKTDNIIGYKYRVRSIFLGEEIVVFVAHEFPLFNPEDIPVGSAIEVEFDMLKLIPVVRYNKGYTNIYLRGVANDVQMVVQ